MTKSTQQLCDPTVPSRGTMIESRVKKIGGTLMLAGGSAALGRAVALGSDATRLSLLGIAGFVFVLGVVSNLREPAARRAGTVFAWIGILAPVATGQSKTVEQVVQTNGITAVGMAQQLVAVACLALSVLLLRPRLLPFTSAERWLAVFLLVAALSSVWAQTAIVTFLKAGQLTVAYLLVLILVKGVPRARLLGQLGTFVHILLVSVIVGWAIDPQLALQQTFDGVTSGVRLSGIYPPMASDIVGLVAAVGIVFTLAHVGANRVLSTPLRRGVAVIAYSVILGLAHSRTALIVVVIGVSILLILTAKTRIRVLTFTPLIGILAVIYASDLTGYLQRGQSAAGFRNLTGRVPLWGVAIAAWEHSPVQGYGFYSGHRLVAPIAGLSQQVSNLDSLWVETLLDVGLLGTIPLMLFVLTGWRDVWGRRAMDGPLPISVAAMCIVASFVNPSLQQLTPVLVIFAVTLLAAGAPTNSQTSSPIPTDPARWSSSNLKREDHKHDEISIEDLPFSQVAEQRR